MNTDIQQNHILNQSAKNDLKNILIKTYGTNFISKFSDNEIEELGISLLNLFVVIMKHKSKQSQSF